MESSSSPPFEQPGDAGAVGDVHPAHAGVERVAADEHLGKAVRDGREGEDLAHGGEAVIDGWTTRTIRSDRLVFATICHRSDLAPSATLGDASLDDRSGILSEPGTPIRPQKDPHEPHPTLHQRPRDRRRRAHRPGLQPGHRRAAARGGVRVRRRGGAGDRRGIRRPAGLARDRPHQARRRVLQAAPPARRAPGRARRDPHERARQGRSPMPRARSRAASRTSSSRRARAPAEGRALRAGRARRRRALDEAAGRRRRRASRPSTSRSWCRSGWSPPRSPAATPSC